MEKKKNLKWLIPLAGILVIGLIMLVIGVQNSPSRRAAKLFDLGQQYLSDGEYEQAIAAFEEALTIDPKNVDAYLGEADAYVALGDYENAIAVLERGLEETNSEEISKRIEELKARNEAAATEIEEQSNVSALEELTEDQSSGLYDKIMEAGNFTLYGRAFTDWTYEGLEEYVMATGIHQEDAGAGWVYSFEGGSAVKAGNAPDINAMQDILITMDDYYLLAYRDDDLIVVTLEKDQHQCSSIPAFGQTVESYFDVYGEDTWKELLSVEPGVTSTIPEGDKEIKVMMSSTGDQLLIWAEKDGKIESGLEIAAEQVNEEWTIVRIEHLR